jgi:hypothetical protein
MKTLPLSLIAASLCCAAGAALAQTPATLSMAEKPVRVIRGASVFKAVNGTVLQKDDIVETGAAGAQIEAGPNSIIALGPQTRLYLVNLAADDKGANEIALLDGWVKLRSATAKRASAALPTLQVSLASGAAILHSKAGKDEMFADEGEQLAARVDDKNKAGAPVKVGGEQYAFVVPGKDLVVQPRPARDFVGEMPPPFRDRLQPAPVTGKPLRLPAVKEREADFADVDAWLAAPLAVRKNFVGRFGVRLKDAEFRKKLDAALGQNSEWKAVLHPAPAAAAGSASASASASAPPSKPNELY